MKERIIQIIETEHLTSGKFALTIGTQPSIISHILNGRNKPSMEIIQKILASFPTINPDWLILGSGSMYRPSSLVSDQPSLFDDVKSKSSDTNQKLIVNKEIVGTSKENSSQVSNTTLTVPVQVKKINKITVYYSDMTFEEFIPSSSILSPSI
jgi:DNA-binding XRE family transcriptional regulator